MYLLLNVSFTSRNELSEWQKTGYVIYINNFFINNYFIIIIIITIALFYIRSIYQILLNSFTNQLNSLAGFYSNFISV